MWTENRMQVYNTNKISSNMMHFFDHQSDFNTNVLMSDYSATCYHVLFYAFSQNHARVSTAAVNNHITEQQTKVAALITLEKGKLCFLSGCKDHCY